MRYERSKEVEEVLAWLRQQGCTVTPRAYQYFIWRVLRLMSLAQAKELGVSVDLLRVVRVRLELPPDPRRARAAAGKAIPRFDVRHRRRPLQTAPRIKRPPAAVPPVKQEGAAAPARSPSAGVASPGSLPLKSDQLTGNPDEPDTLTRQDWGIINRQARLKLRMANRKVLTNYLGTVIHLVTRQEYTPEQLMAEFGLTPTEAQSCYQTFS